MISKKRTKTRQTPLDVPKKFTQQHVDLTKTPLFFPEGFETTFIVLYIVAIPYIAGLFFLFLYVAKVDFDVFVSLNDDSSFLLTWAIGYEVVAALSLIYIFKMSLDFKKEQEQPKKKPPHRRY